MSLWYVARLTTYLDLEYCEILRSGFDFKSNLTSAIDDLANRGFLASYVSRHRAMAYGNHNQPSGGWALAELAGGLKGHFVLWP